MTDQELKEVLWRTGHFRNRANADALNVKHSDLAVLNMDDREVVQAVSSFQQADANLEQFAWLWHARLPIADGHAGPATRALASIKRCPIPDHPPLPGEAFDYGDEESNRVAESYQRWAASTGSGSWPAGCHGTAGVHEVFISHDLSKAPSKVKTWWPEIKQKFYAAVAAVGAKLFEVPVGDPATNIRQSFKPLAGSTIGLAEFNSESCGDSVFCYLDPDYAPDVQMVLILLLHENGHNQNLEHRPGRIMNPSILRVEPFWVKRDAAGAIIYQDNSYPTLKKYFGGEPIDGTPPVIPPPAAEGLVLPWKITDARGVSVVVNKV